MKMFLVVLLVLISSSPSSAHAADNAVPDVARIESVIEAFRLSIIDKDQDRFLALFLPGTVTWQSVRGDERLQLQRERQPTAKKVSIDSGRTHLSFIQNIVNDSEPLEEKFRNVRIDTDGDIATVISDYSFHRGARETNHGQESWHLVHTESGWKIASVIWSVNTSPAPREK